MCLWSPTPPPAPEALTGLRAKWAKLWPPGTSLSFKGNSQTVLSLTLPEFGKSLNLWGLSLVFFRCSSSWNLEVVNENETPGGFPRQAGICWFTRSRPGRQGGLAFCYGKQSAGAGGWVAGTAEEKRNFLSDLETKTTRFLLNSSQLFLFMMSGDHHQNPRRPGEQPLII